jgi:hypothetical protein
MLHQASRLGAFQKLASKELRFDDDFRVLNRKVLRKPCWFNFNLVSGFENSGQGSSSCCISFSFCTFLTLISPHDGDRRHLV